MHPSTSQRVRSVETHVILSRQALEMTILARNKKHFAQAKETPWHRHPLTSISSNTHFNLYVDADDNAIELPPGTFLETATVLQVLKEESAKTHPKWSSDVAFDVFISALLHWKEKLAHHPPNGTWGFTKVCSQPTSTLVENSGWSSTPKALPSMTKLKQSFEPFTA
jgi:hypothetical protein